MAVIGVKDYPGHAGSGDADVVVSIRERVEFSRALLEQTATRERVGGMLLGFTAGVLAPGGCRQAQSGQELPGSRRST